MDGVTAAILLLTAGLAAANGANDVSKGVATLVGAGVTRYRTAVLWGVVAGTPPWVCPPSGRAGRGSPARREPDPAHL